MAVAGAGGVEVRSDLDSRMWYCGHVIDLKADNTLVIAFEADTLPSKGYPPEQVRKPPRWSPAELEKFDPQPGSEVECKINATESTPSAWAVATVRSVKRGFYFMELGNSSESIREKEQLRPLSPATSVAAEDLKQEMFKLPMQLYSWVSLPDAAGCFGHIEEQSGVLHVGVAPQKGHLRIVGNLKAIQRAKLLLDVHVRHQSQIKDFQDRREKRLKILEEKRNRLEGTSFKHSTEFQIDPSFVARVIGKSGEAIRAVEAKYDCNVRIINSDDPDEDRTIRIFANTLESLQKAKAEVEYIEEAIPVKPSMNSWILGRQGKTIRGFESHANLVYARLDRDNELLVLCGTRIAVDDAVAMFETHMMYCPVFQDMHTEMEDIVRRLEEYGDWNARWEISLNRDDDAEPPAQSKAKGKGNAKGGAKSGAGNTNGKNGKSHGKGQDWWWEEKPAARAPRGRGKGSKNEDRWDEAQAGGYPEEETPPETTKGAGKSGRAGGRPRYVQKDTSAAKAEAPAEKASPPVVPSVRRMGKKGVRS